MNRLSLGLLGIMVFVVAGAILYLVVTFPGGKPSRPDSPTASPPASQPKQSLYRPPTGDYTISYDPARWAPKYESARKTIFVHPDASGTDPKELTKLSGFTIWTENFSDAPGVKDQAGWLNARNLQSGSAEVVSRTQAVINGVSIQRFQVHGREGREKVLYVYFGRQGRVITFGLYPYDPSSSDTQSAEEVAGSLVILTP